MNIVSVVREPMALTISGIKDISLTDFHYVFLPTIYSHIFILVSFS